MTVVLLMVIVIIMGAFLSKNIGGDVNSELWEYVYDSEGVTLISYKDTNATVIEIPSEIDGKTVIQVGYLVSIFDNKPNNTVKEIHFSESFKGRTISTACFFNLNALERIQIPNSVERICNHSFGCCYSLKEIIFPNNDQFTVIDVCILWECVSLESMSIPGSVKNISNLAFGNCYKLTNITIPSSVSYIGAYAFNNCYRISDITIETESPPEMNYLCFNLGNTDNKASVSFHSVWHMDMSSYVGDNTTIVQS